MSEEAAPPRRPQLPHVTAGITGSGGLVKASPEDFRVEEIPAYAPQGSGPHLWLRVEKRDRTTRDVARALARARSRSPPRTAMANRFPRR